MKLPAINFHVWKYCNYKCEFCFATFEDVPGQIKEAEALAVVEAVAPHCEKITFVGGEPTLCPFLGALIERAHQRGLTTCVVSNGARLMPILRDHSESLDWVGLSVDSADEAINQALGRGRGGHVESALRLAREARRRGVAIKLNTVVTALNHHEDLSELVRAIRPRRWKVFQVLPVAGQNDGRVEPLLITPQQFHAFVARHAPLAAERMAPIAEYNEDMTGSYVMIDPLGRFFDNVQGRLCYGPRISEVGVERAFLAVQWSLQRFLARGGKYEWRRRTPVRLPVL